MRTISEKDILAIHRLIIEQTGGSHRLRDAGLLNSAVNAPFQTFEGNSFPICVMKRSDLKEDISFDQTAELIARLGLKPLNIPPFSKL